MLPSALACVTVTGTLTLAKVANGTVSCSKTALSSMLLGNIQFTVMPKKAEELADEATGTFECKAAIACSRATGCYAVKLIAVRCIVAAAAPPVRPEQGLLSGLQQVGSNALPAPCSVTISISRCVLRLARLFVAYHRDTCRDTSCSSLPPSRPAAAEQIAPDVHTTERHAGERQAVSANSTAV